MVPSGFTVKRKGYTKLHAYIQVYASLKEREMGLTQKKKKKVLTYILIPFLHTAFTSPILYFPLP